MIIAITYEDGQIFQHFGHTEQFKFYTIENGLVASSQIVSTEGQGHGALAGFLKERGVQVLICGGIGEGAKNALKDAGMELYPGAQGEADQAVIDFLSHKLDFRPDTVCEHHHEKGEGHACGEGSCGNHA